MLFNENRLLVYDSHQISFLTFFRKLGKTSKNLSSAAVVIGALRVNATKNEVNSSLKLKCYKNECIFLL